MAIFKEVVRGDGSGIAEYYRVVSGNVYNVSYDVVTNKPKINGIELVGDISVTDLMRNEGFVQQESDPTVPKHIKLITEGDIIKWQASVDADYVTSVVGEAISNVSQFSLEPVDVLPTEDIKTNVIYAIPSENTKLKNVRDEYVYINGDWECIGSTAIDLGNYPTTLETMNLIQEQLANYEPKDCIIVNKAYLTELGFSSFEFNTMPQGKYYIAESVGYNYITKTGQGSGGLSPGDVVEVKYNEPDGYNYVVYRYTYSSSNYYNPFGFHVYSNGSDFILPSVNHKIEIKEEWDFDKGVKVPYEPASFYSAVNKKYLTDKLQKINQNTTTKVESKTGIDLKTAYDNGTVGAGQAVICTEDYVDDTTTYSKGHIYNLLDDGLSVADQLRNLGYTVTIDEFLENNNIKYFYGAGGFMAFSSEPLDTTQVVLSPRLTWKVQKTYSDQVFFSSYYSNKNINSAPARITQESTDSSSSGAATDSCTNDPADTKLTHYISTGDVEDLTSGFVDKTYVDNSISNAVDEAGKVFEYYYTKEEVEQLISNAVDEAGKVFANYYTKEEVEQLVAQAVAQALGTAETALDEIIEGGE